LISIITTDNEYRVNFEWEECSKYLEHQAGTNGYDHCYTLHVQYI
jgi:hypothetical protein